MADTAHYNWPIVAATDMADTEFTPKVADFQVAVDAAIYALNTGKQDYAARLAAIVASGITTAMFATDVVDTDALLAAASDTRLASQAAIKSYVDNLVTGVSWKTAVRAATTANITLSGAQTIDGVSVVAGNRVLVKNQSTATQNGIYVAASGSWTRALDADSGSELVNATCLVSEGTVNADTQWTCTTNGTITVGSTSIGFAQLGGAGTYTATGGVILTGNQFSADTGTSGHKLPWLDGANTWSAVQIFSGTVSVGGSLAYGALLNVKSAASAQASIAIQNPGIGTAQIGFLAADGALKIRNAYTTGTLASGIGLSIATSGAVSFDVTGTSIGTRTLIVGNNEAFGLGVCYGSGKPAMFIGTSSHATLPDIIFSASGGQELGRFYYGGGLYVPGQFSAGGAIGMTMSNSVAGVRQTAQGDFYIDVSSGGTGGIFRVRNSSSFTTQLSVQTGRTDVIGAFYNLDTYFTGSAISPNLSIDSNGLFQRFTSSLKYKRDVEALDDDWAEMAFAAMNKAAIYYASKCAGDNPAHRWPGFAAEMLADDVPQLVQFRTTETLYRNEKQVEEAVDPKTGKTKNITRTVKTPYQSPLKKPEPEGVDYVRGVTVLTRKIAILERRLAAVELRKAA